MELPILFQSLDRIVGKEGKSKLLDNKSRLYQVLHQLKAEVFKRYEHKGDRMDLHIELTKIRDDKQFRQKAESLQGRTIDLSLPENWGYLGAAFVLWTPEVEAYGRTHITIAFFGGFPKPSLTELQKIVRDIVDTAG